MAKIQIGEELLYNRKIRSKINLNKLLIKFGDHKIIEKGMLVKDYNEDIVAEYMREKNIEIYVEIGTERKI